ncbi:unnamed protein product, partial [Pocillopora meandrina]
SHIEHKALKNVLASGSSRSYYNLRRIRFWEVEMDFPSHGSQLSLAFLLSKSVVLVRVDQEVFDEGFVLAGKSKKEQEKTTFGIRLLTRMPQIPVCCMIFSSTAAKEDSPLPSPFSLAIV